MIKKRSQLERITIADTILSELWQEIREGKIEDDLLQIAAYVQVNADRIVWKLNQINNQTEAHK